MSLPPSLDTRANAGFNSNTKSYSLPGSFTVNDTRLTCGGATGCYTYRVDGATIVAPSATRTPTQSPSSTATRTQAVTPTRSSTATFVPRVLPQPCDPIAQAFCPSERDPPSYTSVTVMNGGAGVGECLLLEERGIRTCPPMPPYCRRTACSRLPPRGRGVLPLRQPERAAHPHGHLVPA